MHKALIFALLAFCVIEISAQTFQYSRGWTNGKRSSVSVTDIPPALRQMIPVLTANDLNNRERLIQHIIKNPCDLRMALLTHNYKPNDDYPPTAADGIDDDAVNRFINSN